MHTERTELGRLDWTKATDGRLTGGERRQLMRQALRLQLRALLQGLTPGTRAKLSHIDEDRLRLPDSALAKDVERELQATADPEVINHSYRAFVFGRLLAEIDGRKPDEEVLLVAALAHDLGITDRFLQQGPKGPCFTLAGAGVIERLGEAGGWDAARTREAAEAVTLHMNILVRPEQGLEAHYLTIGAQLDVLGARYRELAPAVVERVVAKYPRVEMKRVIEARFDRQATISPGTRAHFYHRRLGAARAMRGSPFPR